MSKEVFKILSNINKETSDIMMKSGVINYQCQSCTESAKQITKTADGNPISSDCTAGDQNVTETSKSVKFAERDGKDANSSSLPTRKVNRVCSYYVRGTCRYGSSGKTLFEGSTCKYKHPKKCAIYCKFGSDRLHGCRNRNCKYLHPFLCLSSIDSGTCNNTKCTYQHLKGIQRTENRYYGGSTHDTNRNQNRKNSYFNSRNPIPENLNNQSVGPKLWTPRPAGISESSVEKSLKDIQNSINNLHTENSYIRNKLQILESNNNYFMGRNNYPAEENTGQTSMANQFNPVINQQNFQENMSHNQFAKNYHQ